MIFNIFSFVYTFNLCVVGSKSGLGSELIYQGLQNNKNILALSKIYNANSRQQFASEILHTIENSLFSPMN